MKKIVEFGKGLKAVCHDQIEVWRAETFATKEPGTIDWLKSLRTNDTLYDIGANVGLYSIYAASRGLDVYAFEPHPANQAALLRNIVANGLERQIQLIPIALGATSGYSHLHLSSLAPGSSGSQLYEARDEYGRLFNATVRQWQRVESLDNLHRVILPPNAIKIDVDGREADILSGMIETLGYHELRTVQVEVHASTRQRVTNILTEWKQATSHWTANGQRQCAQGAEPLAIPHNVIFERVSVGVPA